MKILVVEDEFDIANFLIRGLRSEGNVVEHVNGGKEAFNAILNGDFEVVILDILLPDISGEEVLKEVRMKKNDTPVIVLTVIQDTESKIRLLNLGADDYLVKPFSFVELYARIKSISRRFGKKNQNKGEEIVVGDLKIISNRRAMYRGNKLIKLRLKEYELLKYLMTHPDEVIARNTLTEKVWDYNARIFSNTVDSHISLLRKKINEGFDKKIIDTIHGIGFMLRSD